MAGLQRFIAYIYLYENQEKKTSAGFAKIEIRGNSCRMEMHLRQLLSGTKEIKVHLFTVKEERINTVLIGNMTAANGSADARFAFDRENIASSGMSMPDMDGIYIPLENETMLISQWKDGSIKDKQFMAVSRENEDKQEENKNAEEIEKPQSKTENIKEVDKKTEEKPCTSSPDMEKSGQNAEKSGKNKDSKDVQATEIPMQNFISQKKMADCFQLLKQKLPVLSPFEGEETECVRIELKHIRELPKRVWYLGNNSFLLHGFFNYRYLITGRLIEEGRERYFLGIPGVFQNQERVMGTLFGFPDFKAAKQADHKTGEFGYWIRFIDE